MRPSRWILLLILPVLVTACAPGARPLVSAPTFTVLADGTGLRYVDPPGIGSGVAVFDVHLRADNPNPVGLRLAALDGDFYLGGVRAAATSFRGGVDLPARGSADLTLAVRIPLAQVPRLVGTLAQIVGGASTGYRVDASVGVDVLGTVERFPTTTLAQGSVTWSPGWFAPEIRLASQGATLRIESLTRAVLQVPVTWHNPARLGYVVQTPTVQLALGGTTVATASLGRVTAPAGETVPVTLSFSFNPLTAGPALATQVQAAAAGAAELTFRVMGALDLEVPGITTHRFDVAELVQGAVR